MKKLFLLLGWSFAVFASAAEQVLDVLAAPQWISSPYDATSHSVVKTTDYINPFVAKGQWNLNIRYQPASRQSTPPTIANYPVTTYNAINNTGLSVPADYQRGPFGGAGAQSTFQLNGYDIGALMISWDSAHPFNQPNCNPTKCAGLNKHVAYEYEFPENQKFPFSGTGNADNVSVALQGDFQVKQFESNGGTADLYWALYFTGPKQTNPVEKMDLQFVVLMYSSHTPGGPQAFVPNEIVGSTATPYAWTTMNTTDFATVRADSAKQYDGNPIPWTTKDFRRVHITKANLLNAINSVNTAYRAKYGQTTTVQLSTDVTQYSLKKVGVLQEMEYYGDQYVVFGASYKWPGVYLLKQW